MDGWTHPHSRRSDGRVHVPFKFLNFSYRKRFKQNESNNVDLEGETEDYTVDTSVFESVTCHRDVTLGDEKDTPIVKRQVKPYNHVAKKQTQFFSTSDLEVLFRNLAWFVQQAATSFTFSKSSYSVMFDVIKDDGLKVTVTVQILEVPDQKKYWVQTIKSEGDIILFGNIYTSLKTFFGGHANAKHDV